RRQGNLEQEHGGERHRNTRTAKRKSAIAIRQVDRRINATLRCQSRVTEVGAKAGGQHVRRRGWPNFDRSSYCDRWICASECCDRILDFAAVLCNTVESGSAIWVRLPYHGVTLPRNRGRCDRDSKKA